MAPRLIAFSGLLLSLAIATFYPSGTKEPSRLQALSPLLLGFLLGLLVAETPVASALHELFGLTSRNPDKVGLDILHGSSESSSSKEKLELNQRTMYGLQHAFLNLEVTGWWFNMGLWDKQGDQGKKQSFKPMRFQDACQALVHVGFGCGDQDVYMATLYQPSKITGITIEPIQHHAAQELVQRTETAGTEIDLYVADASTLPAFLESNPTVFNNSNDGSSRRKQFSHVISIDSAYHYRTRAQFLKNAAAVLEPETGRLALADMILAKPAPTSFLGHKIFAAVFGAMEVPVENMKSLEEYKQDLIRAGFVDIEIECIEDRVFPGLAHYIENQMGRLGGLVKPGVGWTYWGLCKGLKWLDRSKWLHFVVVKARNGPSLSSSLL
ncbi:hypothetical protein BGZ83_002225 [Gryganskiella cystojenkinii]|nr:hypothetical protein BGZ83_002225 [Gryganskiella cystojenkinii]